MSFSVVREWHFSQRVHEHDEEQGSEYGALGDSRGNLAGGRCEPVDDSALLSVREVAHHWSSGPDMPNFVSEFITLPMGDRIKCFSDVEEYSSYLPVVAKHVLPVI